VDWINPLADGCIACDRDSSCTSDSDEELEHWKNRPHKVSMLCYNMMTNSLRCVSTEVRNLLHYDGLTNVELFLDEFEREVLEEHQFQALELALHATPSYWWGTHKERFARWREYKRMMKLRFRYDNTIMIEKYSGKDDPRDHLVRWTKA